MDYETNPASGIYISIPSFVGIGFNYEGTFLPDNSELRPSASGSGQLSELICASGSKRSNIGQWIAPDGTDVTNSTQALFEVSVGDSDNPGFLSMQQRAGAIIDFSAGTAGVYTCVLPDENDIRRDIRIGIYPLNYINRKLSYHMCCTYM